MTTTTNRYHFIRTLAITLVIASGLFGVAFVGAQEADISKASIVAGDSDTDTRVEKDTVEKPAGGGGTGDSSPEDECSTANDSEIREYLKNPDGTPFDPFDESSITMNGTTATVTVKNFSDTCSFKTNLAVYNVASPWEPGSDTDFLRTQTLFDSHTVTIAPGNTRTFNVDLPSCRHQIDLFAGPTIPQSNPDFALLYLDTHAVLDWNGAYLGNSGLPLCGGDPEPQPICTGPTTGVINTNYTFTASQGTAPYTWNVAPAANMLPSAPNGAGASVTKAFSSASTRTITFTDANDKTATCSIQVSTTPPPLSISCSGAPNPASINQTVTWTSNTSGGNGSYSYSWVGSGGGIFPPNQTGGTVVASYPTTGQKNVVVTVTSGIQTATATCSIQVGTTPPPPPPPTWCDDSVAQYIVSADGTPFNPSDAQEDIIVVNGVASVVVKNISDVCSYNIALISYKAGLFDGTRQEFLAEQVIFDHDVREGVLQEIGPGEMLTLQVDIPQCNYQVDLYSFVDGANPIPEALELDQGHMNGTYHVFDWKVDLSRGSCFITQCPLDPPVITSPQAASGTVGSPFSYTVTTSGAPSNLTVANLPAGLTFSGNTISGVPTQTGTFTAIITATNECAVTAINLVITIGGGSCPFDPPVITSPQTATATVGSPFSYTITTTGTVSDITVANLPAGLTFSGNTISGVPTQSGTFIAIISASNKCATTVINLTVTVGGGSCPLNPPVITSPQTASGTVGSSFSYTITTTGTVSNITVANLPAGLSFSGNTISGTPTETGTFTSIISATNECATTAINLTITIGGNGGGDDDDDDDDDDNGGGGGGGHRRRPNVVLFAEPEVLGTSISLAQIPYTGLGTSIFQLTLFILGLLAISGGIIYTIMRRVRQAPASSVTVTAGPARTTVSIGDEVIDETALAAYEEYAYAVPAPRPVVQNVATPAQTVRVEAPANIPVAAAFTDVPRASMNAIPAVQKNTEMQTVAHVSAARIQNEARTSHALISDDGAELIANSAEGDLPAGAPAQAGEKKALERLNQIIEIAKSRYPREDGWLILDKDRVRETLFISTLSMIPLFVEWIVRGEDKKVFTFLRMLKHQEQPVADFMRKVVSDLDNAYRARMEGSDERANVNQHIAEVTYHLSNKELETIVGELLHGVDERYDSAYTSVRLSLVRVLDIVKERSLRAVGSTYAFADEAAR